MLEINVRGRGERWERDKLMFCPRCGERSIWYRVHRSRTAKRDESGPGVYYEGPEHLCADCGTSFTIPEYAPQSDYPPDQERLKQIRASFANPL